MSKPSHFAHQVAVDQHTVGSQGAVHKGQAGQVPHGRGHSPLHGHQLQAAELALPLLQEKQGVSASPRTLEGSGDQESREPRSERGRPGVQGAKRVEMK